MRYIHYTIEDFVKDEDFIKWVKKHNPETDFFWNSFISQFPEKQVVIESAKEIVLMLSRESENIAPVEVFKMRNNLIKMIREEDSVSSIKYIPTSSSPFKRFFVVAASVLLLVASGISLYLYYNKGFNTLVNLETRENPNGQRSSINLPDGSKVVLNAGSTLKFSRLLNQKNTREVFLEGEAFFEVAKSRSKPFIVHAHTLHIKVLGTSFNVKSFYKDETVETTLVEGSVAINENSNNIVLQPNQKAVFSKKKGRLTLLKVNPYNSTSWKDGRLVFEDETFDAVAEKLERWYGVDLEVIGGKDCKLNFKIGEESLEEVLENFKVATQLTYHTINNKTIINITDCNI